MKSRPRKEKLNTRRSFGREEMTEEDLTEVYKAPSTPESMKGKTAQSLSTTLRAPRGNGRQTPNTPHDEAPDVYSGAV